MGVAPCAAHPRMGTCAIIVTAQRLSRPHDGIPVNACARRRMMQAHALSMQTQTHDAWCMMHDAMPPPLDIPQEARWGGDGWKLLCLARATSSSQRMDSDKECDERVVRYWRMGPRAATTCCNPHATHCAHAQCHANAHARMRVRAQTRMQHA